MIHIKQKKTGNVPGLDMNLTHLTNKFDGLIIFCTDYVCLSYPLLRFYPHATGCDGEAIRMAFPETQASHSVGIHLTFMFRYNAAPFPPR